MGLFLFTYSAGHNHKPQLGSQDTAADNYRDHSRLRLAVKRNASTPQSPLTKFLLQFAPLLFDFGQFFGNCLNLRMQSHGLLGI